MVMFKGTIKSNPYVFFCVFFLPKMHEIVKKDSKYIYNVTKDTNVTKYF